MALRPPRVGFSLARRLSERARAGRAETTAPDSAGLTGMVDTLRGLVQLLAEAGQAAADTPTEDVTGGQKFTFGGGKGSVVFGYTLKMGPDGMSAERFGDMPDAAPAPAATPPRQPIVEVFEEDATVVVVAELPGADPNGIVCRPEGQRLLIETAGARRYRKTVALPAKVRPDGMQQSFRNGILEVRLARADAGGDEP